MSCDENPFFVYTSLYSCGSQIESIARNAQNWISIIPLTYFAAAGVNNDLNPDLESISVTGRSTKGEGIKKMHFRHFIFIACTNFNFFFF